jgi:hypothetical protein
MITIIRNDAISTKLNYVPMPPLRPAKPLPRKSDSLDINI